MSAPGIVFTATRPPAPPASSRADIALFAGLIARRQGPLPKGLLETLAADAPAAEAGGFFDERLLGVPVRIDSWDQFDRLFDWTQRSRVPGSTDTVPAALGLAVRQFFLQGGSAAYVVRCGDPLPVADPEASPEAYRTARGNALSGKAAPEQDRVPILPGLQNRSNPADPLDPASWLGAAAIFGVMDAAMLVLPDVADLTAEPLEAAPEFVPVLGQTEQWRPCAPAAGESDMLPARPAVQQFLAPRFGQDAYRRWSQAVSYGLTMLGRPRGPAHRRDVMLVSALPLPQQTTDLPERIANWPLPLLDREGYAGTEAAPLALFDEAAIGNARLQLGYPWMKTPEAAACPEGLQSPEGALAGILARSALEKGAFRSAANSELRGPVLLHPSLALNDRNRGYERPAGGGNEHAVNRADWLGDRLCLFEARRGAVRMISDATFAQSRAWRSGGVSRLMGIVLRAARHLGEDLMFEPSGPRLWRGCADRMIAILERLRTMGAFSGASARECYRVTCDRSTMTASDIDAGRVRCDVVLNPASPIERIEVNLALIEPLPSQSTREAA
ncbi:hypothetical protein [Novosphingobium beihaiensis]|uniref:Phage tail protein n=1 Tax=Novosphingobium beihaiensis TaxID=2930389 RepID=A0ABT0BN66_9SPHN|nr:hypothetical protein [Novosphingobium beihaiensis]MCJ2186490.1 hypothetical protein [Novosphingobium beihaiensis]